MNVQLIMHSSWILCLVSMKYVLAWEKLNLSQEWKDWKSLHGKTYVSVHDELEKQVTWLANQEFINAHNKYDSIFGFTLGMNQFGDMTDLEFKQTYSCIAPPDVSSTPTLNKTDQSKYGKSFKKPKKLAIPQNLDWRSMGVVTEPDWQGQCGSCYAFGALGALEGLHALSTGKLVGLSAQNVIDCSGDYGNNGCEDGSVENTYAYIINANGIDTSKSYPYERQQGKCRFKSTNIGASMRYYNEVTSGDEQELLFALVSHGPIAAVVDASHNLFRFYKNGVMNIPYCSKTKVSQALLVIGYGYMNGREYWLVKNSWGYNWGQNGAGMLSRNMYNQCGIATKASFPSI